MEDLGFAASDSDETDSEDEGEFGMSDSSMGMDEILADGEIVWSVDREEAMDSDELAELLDDAKDMVELPLRSSQNPPRKKRKTQEEPVVERKVVTPIFDLVEPEFVPSKTFITPSRNQRRPCGRLRRCHVSAHCRCRR